MKTLLKWILPSFLLMFAGIALAQIPETQYSEGIAYISGGVGEEESAAILGEAKQWPLLLELSQIENGRGVWIFGAIIKITNAKNHVLLHAQANGPYMLINLEPGDYAMQASYQGAEQKRAFNLKANSSQKISVFWK